MSQWQKEKCAHVFCCPFFRSIQCHHTREGYGQDLCLSQYIFSFSLYCPAEVRPKWGRKRKGQEVSEKIRNKSLTSDISWTALLLQLVKSCSNFSQLLTSHQMPREDTKNALNDLYLSLYDVEYSKASKNFLKTRGDVWKYVWIYFQCPINLSM